MERLRRTVITVGVHIMRHINAVARWALPGALVAIFAVVNAGAGGGHGPRPLAGHVRNAITTAH